MNLEWILVGIFRKYAKMATGKYEKKCTYILFIFLYFAVFVIILYIAVSLGT